MGNAKEYLKKKVWTCDESCGCEECQDDYKEAEREGRSIKPIREKVISESDALEAVRLARKEGLEIGAAMTLKGLLKKR